MIKSTTSKASTVNYLDWLDEYYPITGKDAAKHGSLVAARHSLKRWQGCRPAVLQRYDMRLIRTFDRFLICSKDGAFELYFSSSECALCKYSALVKERAEAISRLSLNSACDVCPIVLSGELGCADPRSAYRERDMKGMIEVLRRTVKWVEENEKR